MTLSHWSPKIATRVSSDRRVRANLAENSAKPSITPSRAGGGVLMAAGPARVTGRNSGSACICRQIIYDEYHMKRVAARAKDITHEHIVEAAARAIRRSGYDGTSVADIMKGAGLTHGGFYAHFRSREAMLAEAADRAGAESVASLTRIAAPEPTERALEALLRAYLSKEHVKNAETGCPIAALGSETPRQAPEVRRAATRRIKEMIDFIARLSPDWGQPGAHESALVTVATAVGALLLARAVDEPKLSDALLAAALKHLSSALPE